MQFQPISLEHRDLFLKLQNQSQMPLSDFNFTNLWIWRFAREISFAYFEECLVIKTTYPNQEPYYFFPLGKSYAKALEALLAFAPNARFKSLNLTQAQYLKETFNLSFSPNRDRFDYVYSIPELIALSGRKYHKKKNHLNKFLQTYPDFVFEEVQERHINELRETYQKWFSNNPNQDDALRAEKAGIQSILQDFKILNQPSEDRLFALKGGILRVKGEIIAFSFAEALSKESIVVHIEKANTAYAGVFQAINQQFLSHLWGEYLWANREEDLGIEGLRKAKLSYQPAHLLEKYEI